MARGRPPKYTGDKAERHRQAQAEYMAKLKSPIPPAPPINVPPPPPPPFDVRSAINELNSRIDTLEELLLNGSQGELTEEDFRAARQKLKPKKQTSAYAPPIDPNIAKELIGELKAMRDKLYKEAEIIDYSQTNELYK